MKYWWVNHRQTYRQEISGSYLWSPKREASGARSQFYDNVRLATPGDFVLSYADGLVRYAGVVADYPLTAPKPTTFGSVGAYWDSEGWLLPMRWLALAVAIPPKTILKQIAPLLPKKYSPLRAETGDGNQKAYLAEIDDRLFSLVLGLGGSSFSALRSDASGEIDLVQQLEQTAQLDIERDSKLPDTVKAQLILARRGQGLFREKVRAVERRCRLTKLDNSALLTASHIKPWRACSTAAERLDGHNGLMLAPHVDRIFDRGLISFTDQGDVLISPRMVPDDLRRLGLRQACEANCGSFSEKQKAYLHYHREQVFLP